MIEGQFESLLHRHAAFDRPGQQMCQMLRRRSEDFGADEPAVAPLRVDAQYAFVLPDDAGSALIGDLDRDLDRCLDDRSGRRRPGDRCAATASAAEFSLAASTTCHRFDEVRLRRAGSYSPRR